MNSEPENALPELAFAELSESLQAACGRAGWSELMPVQAKAIPYVLAGRDLMVHSRTGSGKTGAFILPLFDLLDRAEASTQALVLVPTRELARQVHREAEMLFGDSGLRTVSVYGGVGYGPQLDGLREGAHLVVGTPGRILDHLERRSMVLDKLRVLIFDEADRMLSVGFYPDMKAIDTYLPRKRHGYMFSATYPPVVLSLAEQFLHEPEMLSLSKGHEAVAETDHVAYEVGNQEKSRSLIRIIEMENPDSAIIFTNTKANANFVAVVLQRFGYDAEQISSDLSQAAREKVLARLYEHELRFLVATDVAARGIDVENLSHVILYDFPEDPESYIHRTGRTGRAGASGEAIALVDPVENLRLKAVARRYDIEVEKRPLPSDDDIAAIVAERVTAVLEAKLRKLDRLVVERMRRMDPLVRHLAEDEDERRILTMLLDEHYQGLLHAVPDLPPLHTTRRGTDSGRGGTEEAAARRGGRRGGPGGGGRGGRGGGGGRSGGRRRR